MKGKDLGLVTDWRKPCTTLTNKYKNSEIVKVIVLAWNMFTLENLADFGSSFFWDQKTRQRKYIEIVVLI